MAGIADFEEDKSYKLKPGRLVMDKRFEWLKAGTELKVVRKNEDDTLLVSLPDGGYATCASFMLEAPTEIAVAKTHADFADFSVRVAGNKEETLPIPDAPTVEINGKKYVERDVPLLFQTGEFPDKEFNMTPEEGQLVADDFINNLKEIPITISHKPTILDAHNGSKFHKLEYKVVEENGKKIGRFSGKALLEPYLDSFLKKDKTFGMSARFVNKDGELKRFVHAALVPNPRIEAARVQAGSDFEKALVEFAKDIPTMTGYGSGALSTGKTEDTGADLPPIPTEEAPATKSPQADNLPKESPTGTELQEAENGGKTPEEDTEGLEEMGDYDEPQGAELWDMIGELVQKAMKESPEGAQKIVEMLSKGKAAEGGAATPPTPVPPTPAMTPAAEPVAAKPDANFEANEKAKKELESDREKLDKEKVDFEVSTAVGQFRIQPHQQEAYKITLLRAAKDDRLAGTADFAAGDSRFNQAVKLLRDLPVSSIGGGANFSGGTLLKSSVTPGQKTSEEVRKENDSLMARTPMGAACMEFNRKNGINRLNGNN